MHCEAYGTFILGFVTCGLGEMTVSQRDKTFQNFFRASIAVGKKKNIVGLVLGSVALLFLKTWRN
jgi:hypothetical protein